MGGDRRTRRPLRTRCFLANPNSTRSLQDHLSSTPARRQSPHRKRDRVRRTHHRKERRGTNRGKGSARTGQAAAMRADGDHRWRRQCAEQPGNCSPRPAPRSCASTHNDGPDFSHADHGTNHYVAQTGRDGPETRYPPATSACHNVHHASARDNRCNAGTSVDDDHVCAHHNGRPVDDNDSERRSSTITTTFDARNFAQGATGNVAWQEGLTIRHVNRKLARKVVPSAKATTNCRHVPFQFLGVIHRSS